MERSSMFMKGVTVLDLSRHLPGPLATLMMVDMGARVIKIESPSGDEVRELGPRDDDGRPVYFDTLHAGKEVRRIDLKAAAGREAFLALVREADVVVDSFRPGVMQRLGLGHDDLSKVNPGIVSCSLSGYGRSGPMVDAAGHDANYLALAGVLDRNRGTGKTPVAYEPPLADSSGSLFAVIGILGALRARDRDGKGCDIDLALADTAMPLQMLQIAEMQATHRGPDAAGGYFNGGTAYYATYATSDGRFMSLGAVEPKFWSAFCNAAKHPEWIARQAEPLPQRSLGAEVEAFFAARTLAELESMFDGVDCCLTPVLALEDAVHTDHVEARGLLRADANGRLQALLPMRVDGQPPALRAPVVQHPARTS